VTNPKVLVEVTSDGTERYDRGEKLEQYKRIASLEAIVIVSHLSRRIEVWTRLDAGWQVALAVAGERAQVTPVGCTLEVDAIYAAAEEPAPA
jgi:Uma2 family endonuclease